MPSRADERLQQNRHEVRDHDDAEQRVAELGPAGDVGRPVAGIHVADRDEIAGAGEGQHLPPEAAADRNGNGSVDFGKAQAGGWSPGSSGAASGSRSIATLSVAAIL